MREFPASEAKLKFAGLLDDVERGAPRGQGATLGLALTIIGLAGRVLASPPPSNPAATAWYSLSTTDGAVVGYASEDIAGTPAGRRVVDRQVFSIVDEDGTPTRTTTVTTRQEDAAGRPLWIAAESRSRSDWSRVVARISPGHAEVVRQTPSGRQVASVLLPPGVRFDDGGGLLAAWDPAATPRLDYDAFDAAAMAVDHVVLTASAGAPARGAFTAIRQRFDHGALVGVARLELDAARHVVAATQPLFGVSLIMKPVDRATALRPRAAYRLVSTEMIPSPYRISTAAAAGHIRYRFSFRDGLAFTLPETGDQGVRADGAAEVVDVCDGCGPGLPSDPVSLAADRAPAPWLQSDDPRIMAIAEPIARLKVSDARKMQLLSEETARRLSRVDYVGHYSALDALRRGSGDCTETAVLLAALGRAAGIPTRVANGLAYSAAPFEGVGNAFMPHSWTLAFVDGRWRAFDAASKALDSTYIALTVGDGDARALMAAGQLAGLLRWDSLAEVRAAPAP